MRICATDGVNKWAGLFMGLFSVWLFLSSFCFLATETRAQQQQQQIRWQQDQITVHYSLSQVEEVFLRCEDYKHLFKKITESRRLSRNECYLETSKAGQNKQLWLKIQVDPGRADADGRTVRMQVRKLDGNLKTFEARIELRKLQERQTMVILRIQGNPGLPAIADHVVDNYLHKVIRDALVTLSTRLLLGRY